MQKKNLVVSEGVNSKAMGLLVNRLIPGKAVRAVGPFVFLDHVYPILLGTRPSSIPTGEFAHPHRGIATFSYVLEGKLSHYDSRGNHAVVGPGGIQWMKAGKGIIHDEQPLYTNVNDSTFHSLQFWINLPAEAKSEEPEYRVLQAEQVPEIWLPGDAGVLRLLLGEFGSVRSPVKTFCREFIYHFRLNPKSKFAFVSRVEMEYGVFVPSAEMIVNETGLAKSKIAIFGPTGLEIRFENPDILAADIFIFGGLHYDEATIAEGPFVMNSRKEVAEAYRDFFEGKYGIINYTNE